MALLYKSQRFLQHLVFTKFHKIHTYAYIASLAKGEILFDGIYFCATFEAISKATYQGLIRTMKQQRQSNTWMLGRIYRTYIVTIGLLGLCSLMGFAGIGAARYVFMVGCLAVGYIAWKDSPGRHLEATIVLFCFAPFVRRVIDVGSGFDIVGLMLSGPLLAMAVPCVELKDMLFVKRKPIKDSGPFLIAAGCILYGSMLSVFKGDYQIDEAQTLKWFVPVLYGLWIMEKSREQDNDMIGAISRAFLIVTPIMGVYGVFQYLNPLVWDRYWMVYAGMSSIGLPLPFQVRVFSTMNSPASFATFATIGLLVFGFTRKGWLALSAGIFISLALMLSQYRTAWIALGAGLTYGFLFASTRGRSTGIIVVGAIVAILAVTGDGPISDMLSQRFASMQQGAQDGSAVERISEYVGMYTMSDDYVFGKGFATMLGDVPGLVAVDGAIISCFLVMGFGVGTVCLLALAWACLRALSRIGIADSRMRVATGAVVIGMLVSIPLQGVLSGEFGFLFWTFVAIATAQPVQNSNNYNSRSVSSKVPMMSFSKKQYPLSARR
jgi:hypothetical protein